MVDFIGFWFDFRKEKPDLAVWGRTFEGKLGLVKGQIKGNADTAYSCCRFPPDTVSEWLRRWTRNPLGSARRGSNPLGVVAYAV